MSASGSHSAPAAGHPIAAKLTSVDPHVGLIATPVHTLLQREPVQLPPTATIRAAAQLMREQRVSSILIVEQERLFGIVTDRDLRNRVIAAGLPTIRPILDIATLAPISISLRTSAFDALLLMARQNIHHLPVLDAQRIVGLISATDLTEQHSTSAVYLAGEIYKQGSVEALQRTSLRIRQLQQHLSAADATAYATGHVITAVTDALTTRLLQLGEAQFGPAPVEFAWVAAGSQARNEQTAKSDQDNCLLLADDYAPERDGPYFEALSRFVCDGLNACGYVHCPGKIMAVTDEWRQPLHRWRQYFAHWTREPEPKALMLSCVFFDMRCVYGSQTLLDSLRAGMLEATRGNQIFLALMVGNALSREPPLSMFGRITPARSGAHRGTIDLKHLGIVPIVDLARIYALAGGHACVNTHERLEVAAQSGEVSQQSAHDLRDALEYLAGIRIRHQARQMQAHHAADNFLALDELSNFERTQLKEAFDVVRTLQQVLNQRYRGAGF